ncbi:MAG TPA: calcium-binding protein [Actinomycetota bacterium]|nr:calcium-binding protein [Actinomycetota bacterium]
MGIRASAALRAVALISLVAALVPAGPAASRRLQPEDKKCFGFDPTIVGTRGDDVIRGTRGFDIISALEGNDEVRAGGGPDFVCAGDGDDLVRGGPSFDLIEALTGADRVYGEGAADLFLETSLPEDPQGPAYVHVGDVSDDEWYGGPGDDLMTDDGANDLLDGGEGRDTYLGLFNFSPMVVNLATGHSSSGRGDVNTLVLIENAYGGLYADVLLGGEGPNVLSGTFGPDLVHGEGGSDLLFSMVDGDLLDGGGGHVRDAVMVVLDEGIEADLADGVVSAPESGRVPDRLVGIDDLIGGVADDVIVGSDGANRLYGGGGDDMLDGTTGADTIMGDGPFWPWVDRAHWWRGDADRKGGADVLIGGDGKDRLDGGPARDECRSGEVIKRCEVVPSDAAAARRRRPSIPRGLDAWWFPLVLDHTARPWLELVPPELRR